MDLPSHEVLFWEKICQNCSTFSFVKAEYPLKVASAFTKKITDGSEITEYKNRLEVKLINFYYRFFLAAFRDFLLFYLDVIIKDRAFCIYFLKCLYLEKKIFLMEMLQNGDVM